MKLLTTADLHFMSKHSAFPVGPDGASDLLRVQRETVEQFVDLYRSGEYDMAIVAGDVTEVATLDPATMDLLSYFMQLLNEEDHGPVIILEGNHCIDRKDKLYTVMGAFKRLAAPHVFVSVSQEVFRFNLSLEGDVVVWCFPYRSDYKGIEDDIRAASEEAKTEDALHIMVFHLPASNAMLDSGIKSTHGVSITSEITEGFHVGVGGDFHTHQILEGNDKCFYVGAPHDLKFGEAQERAFCVVEVDRDGYSLERVPVAPHIPMLTLTYDEAVSRPELIRNAVVRIQEPLSANQKMKLDSLGPYSYSSKVKRAKRKEFEDVDVANISSWSGDDFEEIVERAGPLSPGQRKYLKSEFEKIRGKVKWDS